jgi:hypothetical protein
MTFLVALVFTMAALGVTLSLGVLAETLVRSRRIRHTRHESVCTYYGRPAFHH